MKKKMEFRHPPFFIGRFSVFFISFHPIEYNGAFSSRVFSGQWSVFLFLYPIKSLSKYCVESRTSSFFLSPFWWILILKDCQFLYVDIYRYRYISFLLYSMWKMHSYIYVYRIRHPSIYNSLPSWLGIPLSLARGFIQSLTLCASLSPFDFLLPRVV